MKDTRKFQEIIEDRSKIKFSEFYPLCLLPEEKWSKNDKEDYPFIIDLQNALLDSFAQDLWDWITLNKTQTIVGT
tara:strand:+ start:420 stop:644 length:225 start_codon:yes stop_codon:yes gene_type:complete